MFVSRISLSISLWLLVSFSGLWGESTSFKVPVPQDVIDDYRRLLGPRDAYELKRYSGNGARRDVIELVLIQQALARVNHELRLELKPMRSYRAILQDVAAGRYIMAATSVWRTDADALVDAFWITDPVIRQGQFEAGFYTYSTNQAVLSTQTLEQLQQLRAVTNRHWRPDWDTLQGLGFKEVRDVRSWESIVRVLASKRADFTLAPFNSEPDMRIVMDDCILLPIPNLKTSLIGERTFVVSRKHPDGETFFTALQEGLRKLQADGTIERAYRECGFINPQVSDWERLSPEPVD